MCFFQHREQRGVTVTLTKLFDFNTGRYQHRYHHVTPSGITPCGYRPFANTQTVASSTDRTLLCHDTHRFGANGSQPLVISVFTVYHQSSFIPQPVRIMFNATKRRKPDGRDQNGKRESEPLREPLTKSAHNGSTHTCLGAATGLLPDLAPIPVPSL